MCGITGFFCPHRFSEMQCELPNSAAMLSTRGPDDSGSFYEAHSGLGLAHRRLSIIDLSTAGHQPMQSHNGQAVIIFNGEIYNFKTIRSNLQEFGYQFKSDSDTEVILNAYLHWGTACLERFVGMFAFAIWDRSRQRLFLARDRLGIKPLYYFINEDTFIFGSELRALMAFSNFQRVIDQEAFHLYLHYQYVPAPRTIFRQTFKLEPGHFLIYDGKTLQKRQWWTVPTMAPVHGSLRPLTEKGCLNTLDQLLTQAVSDRLISDVPLGALLSGGVDSSIVVALMQKVSRSPVKTFSIGFQEKEFNEAPWASKIAKHLGTDHTELYVTPQDALETIPQLPEIYNEPFADSSAVPSLLVSRMTRKQVTVALSGDGGDELFAGYLRYWITQKMALWMKWLPETIRRALNSGFGRLPTSGLTRLYYAIRNGLPRRLQVENFPDKWEKLITQLNCNELSELYRMTISIWSKHEIFKLTGGSVPKSAFETIFFQSPNLNAIQTLMMVDQLTYLPDAMLTKVDRASMAASLEVRVPLLDHRVVEFAAQLPESLKIRDGKGKYLLRRLLLEYVPRELVERPKMGFGVPIADWLRKELRELLDDYLSPVRLKQEGLLNPTVVSQIMNEHMEGTKNHQHQLWTLLMWEMWREKWDV